MPDYKEMYHKLFNSVTDAINTLQEAQRQTEEMYMRDGEKKVLLLKPDPDENPKP